MPLLIEPFLAYSFDISLSWAMDSSYKAMTIQHLFTRVEC